MPCYHPLTAWRKIGAKLPDGRWPVTFDPNEGHPALSLQIPCGQCIGCRLERSRQWAARCVLEASMHDENSFITLTYADENLPSDGSLKLTDYQKFMKRLRKRFDGQTIRFFHCGEYGERFARPHYHAILFGFDFADKELWSIRNGQRLYISDVLSELWPFGWSTIGDVTFESAAYVARYITKKITGVMADEHYGGRVPEYCTMSRRPGIARSWFDEYESDVYPGDVVLIRDSIRCHPPRYFDAVYEESHPLDFAAIKAARRAKMEERAEDYTPERLSVKEELQRLRAKKLIRPYEEE